MDENILKNITALADDEIKDIKMSDKLNELISSDKNIFFMYELLVSIRKNLKERILKHPAPYSLRQKLEKLSHEP
jgi:hypothetical protein